MSVSENDLYTTLLVLGRFTQMVDVFDFFEYDCEKLLRFVDRFGGMSIKVPDRNDLGRMARDVHIWTVLRKNRNMRAVRSLADLYGLAPIRVTDIYKKTNIAVSKLDEQSGMNVENWLHAKPKK